MSTEFITVRFKDSTVAFGGIKKAVLRNKGKYNNEISAMLFDRMEQAGIKTHFVKIIDERTQQCLKTEIIPLQVIVRNRIAGSTAELLGVDNGTVIPNTVYELRYRNEELGYPMINRHHAVALGLSTYEELERIFNLTCRVNDVLKDIFGKAGIELIDFKMEVGRLEDGTIVPASGIDPDNSRLWDIETGEMLDKDRFRHDLSDVCSSYRVVMERLKKVIEK